MTLICFASQKGSPGTTATALAVAAALSPPKGGRKLLLEADSTGGTLAIRYRLAVEPGLLTLAAAARGGIAAEDLWRHAQELPGGLPVVVCPDGPEQVHAAMSASGAELGRFLNELRDVYVVCDVGRLAPESPVLPFVAQASAVLMVARPNAEQLQPAARRMATLKPRVRNVGWILIGEKPYGAADVQSTFGFPVVGVIADDARSVASLERGVMSKRLRRHPFIRSSTTVARTLTDWLEPLSVAPTADDPAVIVPVAPPPDLPPPELPPPDLRAPDLPPPNLGAPDLPPPNLGAPDLPPPELPAPDLGAPDLPPPNGLPPAPVDPADSSAPSPRSAPPMPPMPAWEPASEPEFEPESELQPQSELTQEPFVVEPEVAVDAAEFDWAPPTGSPTGGAGPAIDADLPVESDSAAESDSFEETDSAAETEILADAESSSDAEILDDAESFDDAEHDDPDGSRFTVTADLSKVFSPPHSVLAGEGWDVVDTASIPPPSRPLKPAATPPMPPPSAELSPNGSSHSTPSPRSTPPSAFPHEDADVDRMIW